jgi:hypothetical protein
MLPNCKQWGPMAESTTILASLDQFIEALKTEEEIGVGQTMATAQQSLATTKPAEIHGIGLLGHFGHSGRHTRTDNPPYPVYRNDRRPPDGNGSHDLLFSGGYSGKSGHSQGIRGFDSGHSGNGNGHSGHSCRDHQAQVGSDDIEIVHSSAVATSGPEVWRDLYQERAQERAAIREYDGGYSRSEAELLAWRELEWRWHMAHCQAAPDGVCAGCQQPLGSEDVILLVDRNRVHNRSGHVCLIEYRQRWRDVATKALISIGLRPPTGAV